MACFLFCLPFLYLLFILGGLWSNPFFFLLLQLKPTWLSVLISGPLERASSFYSLFFLLTQTMRLWVYIFIRVKTTANKSKKRPLLSSHFIGWFFSDFSPRLPFSFGASLVAQMVKDPPAMRDTQVQSLGGEDPLEKGTATHCSILAWRILWTEEPHPWGRKKLDMTEWLTLSLLLPLLKFRIFQDILRPLLFLSCPQVRVESTI